MELKDRSLPIEIWGGIECTINRVQGQYFDQMARSGHTERDDDLALFADLGLRKMRYPVLWEKVVTALDEAPDWSWPDERLGKLKALHITPIVGLLHHGSGPTFTNLLDPAFPDLFAAYARQVAMRYPWIKYYTPINEPLTTARFSALYGHWYPHKKDDLSFSKAIINQVSAIKKAMVAIREINPDAQLVQTEDLGKTHSTKVLSYQAKFENERRWLTFDLLYGKVTPTHRMWRYFLWAGIEESELASMMHAPCPPDIIGINHYLSSERYLDNRTLRYPAHLRGGNGKHRYADIEAVRVGPLEPAGYYNLLKETCQRYEAPVAITEVHMGGTREEQLRWFYEAYQAASILRQEGFKIEAITAWAILGLYDWNALVMHERNFYESGLFDVRGDLPRPTAIARLVKALIQGETGGDAISPLTKLPGWWRRAERVMVVQPKKENMLKPIDYGTNSEIAPVLITGASGTLGRAFARICQVRGIPYRLLGRQDLDIANPVIAEKVISALRPWAVINTAGYVKVDLAESDVQRCYRENTHGPAILSAICAEKGIQFISFSSDLVFDGKQTSPYLEDHPLAPLGVYGLSKRDAENDVLLRNPKALIIRTSAFFGPWDDHNFVIQAIRAAERKEPFYAANDQCISPTYVPDLVNICLDLLIDGERGIWNIANQGELTWAELAQKSVAIAGLETSYVVPLPTKKMNFIARRPTYSALGSKRGTLLPPLEESLDKFKQLLSSR